MKKLLLFGAFLIGSYFTASAQNNCTGAVAIAGTGTIVVPALTGGTAAPAGTCFAAYTANPAGQAAAAKWYKFTPTSAGLITIDTGIAANPVDATDTRVRVMTGSCLTNTFTCVASNDDINEAAEDYRSRISNLVVAANTTYYIVFDNRWLSSGFSVDFTFTAQSCFAPTAFTYVGTPTQTSVTIGWTAPTTGTPTGYQIEYGPQGYTQGQGAIATFNPTGTQQALTPLTPGTVYSFYIRTNCGLAGYSNWVGPISFNSVFPNATTPYSMGFEGQDNLDFLGWASLPGATGSDWSVETAANGTAPATGSSAQEGTQFAQAGANGGISDAWLFSRPINLTANTPVTLTYYMRKAAFAGAGNVNNLQVTWGTGFSAATQTNTLATYTDYQSQTYEQKTHTFTPTTTGTYVIGFRYTAPAHAQTNFGAILLDNVVVTAAAGTNDFLAGRLSIYPNPANNVINIANADNILINGAEIVDLNGRTVKVTKFNGVSEAQINISDLASGMYMMTVSSDQGTLTKKIVKQ